MRLQVDEMLEAQTEGPFESIWSSPVVLVAMPNSTQRFCLDYRALNMIAKRDLYMLPRCDENRKAPQGSVQ